jgi:hypothetical protein
MKNIYELLRQKELEISRLETEVDALRVAAPLLSDDEENKMTSDRSSTPIQVPETVNANPQPAHSAEWLPKAQRRW